MRTANGKGKVLVVPLSPLTSELKPQPEEVKRLCTLYSAFPNVGLGQQSEMQDQGPITLDLKVSKVLPVSVEDIHFLQVSLVLPPHVGPVNAANG